MGKRGVKMTKKEFGTIFAMIKLAYPSFTKDLSEDEVIAKIGLWYSMLRGIDIDDLKAGVEKYISNNQFPPTIADLKEYSLNTNFLNAEEAWDEIQQAGRKYGLWDIGKSKTLLSPLTLKAAEQIGLREIYLSEDIELTRTRFVKIFEIMFNREKADALLSGNTKDLLKNSAQAFLMEK
jgi:hypothetical protein